VDLAQRVARKNATSHRKGTADFVQKNPREMTHGGGGDFPLWPIRKKII